jgi:hypothetical protein
LSEDSEGPHGLDIAYVADFYGDALFAESADAKLAADKCRAVANSATWGEFGQAWPDSDFEWLEGRFEGNPPDDAEFSRNDVPPVGEGFPEDPRLPDVVVDWFPEDLIERYGGKVGFTDGGYHLTLPGKHAHEIAAELRARGNVVEESVDDIPEWISYYYGEIDPRAGRARAAQPVSPLG